MQRFLLGYLFLSFVVGVACFGVAVVLAVRRRDAVSRAFFAFYAALSVLVTASLVLTFADTAPGVIPASVRQVFRYVESIVGLYGVMLTVPLLVHRVFGVRCERRERILIGIVLTTLVLQHVTEFALGSTVWDQRGDWFEDGVLIVLVAYSLGVAWSRRGAADVERPLATRLFVLLALGVPGVLYDLLFGESLGVRLYPLWYSVTSVVVIWTLLRDGQPDEIRPSTPAPRVADRWGLSERELEVAHGVARGLSNKEVAAALHISPNTVKTHLRAIFDKTGVQSRFELISLMVGLAYAHHDPQAASHPEG